MTVLDIVDSCAYGTMSRQYLVQSCSISHSIFNVIGSLSNQIRDVLPVL